MSGESWNEVMERERRKVSPPKPLSPSQTGENALLPGMQHDYKAAAAPANHGLTRLVCILGKGEFQEGRNPYRFFQYVYLGATAELGFTKDGQVMTLYFTGPTAVRLTIWGRNLLQICDYIQLHRMAWIRVADRDFFAHEAIDNDGQPLPIITKIEITPMAFAELAPV